MNTIYVVDETWKKNWNSIEQYCFALDPCTPLSITFKHYFQWHVLKAEYRLTVCDFCSDSGIAVRYTSWHLRLPAAWMLAKSPHLAIPFGYWILAASWRTSPPLSNKDLAEAPDLLKTSDFSAATTKTSAYKNKLHALYTRESFQIKSLSAMDISYHESILTENCYTYWTLPLRIYGHAKMCMHLHVYIITTRWTYTVPTNFSQNVKSYCGESWPMA